MHISSGSSQYSEPTPDTPPRAPPRSHLRPLARALVHDVFRLAPGAAGGRGRGRPFVLASIKYGNHALPPSFPPIRIAVGNKQRVVIRNGFLFLPSPPTRVQAEKTLGVLRPSPFPLRDSTPRSFSSCKTPISSPLDPTFITHTLLSHAFSLALPPPPRHGSHSIFFSRNDNVALALQRDVCKTGKTSCPAKSMLNTFQIHYW